MRGPTFITYLRNSDFVTLAVDTWLRAPLSTYPTYDVLLVAIHSLRIVWIYLQCPKTSSPEVNVSPSPVGGTGGGGGAAVATSSTANSSPVTAGAMAVVTSLTLTEAETAVHLPAPPSPSSATVAVAGQTINVSVDNSRCVHYPAAYFTQNWFWGLFMF